MAFVRAMRLWLLAVLAPVGIRSASAVAPSYETEIIPLLQQYCYGCHGGGKKKGDLTLDAYSDAAHARADRRTWQRVLENVQSGTMPPENKKQPTPDERDRILRWIDLEVFHCDCEHPDPGRVTVRRLNRVEYNLTIRDLVGVDFQPADDFPADDAGFGFDNNGDVLSLPPVLLEKYLSAAQRILDAAIITEPARTGASQRFAADSLEGSAPGDGVGGGARMLAREGDIFTRHRFISAGEYIFRARAWGQQAGFEPTRMQFRLGTNVLETFDVKAVEASPEIFEKRVSIEAGTHRFAAAYINNYVNPNDPDPNNRDRNLIIDYLEIVGPFGGGPPDYPETHRRIFWRPTTAPTNEVAREIIERFARRAYRRPLREGELSRLMTMFELGQTNGENFEMSVSLALQGVLVSPHFLFRGELQPQPDDPATVHPIDEFALASRLSYFLWSTMPDETLFALAERGQLRAELAAQVRRMLADPKARALVDHFAGQWLQLRNLQLATPDPWLYPEFDEELRAAMQRETELTVEHLIRDNRSVLEFLDADYTFLNERLARHYGISGVKGAEFRRVSLRSGERGGVLAHGSILTLTSNPTRTSPVKRGKWVLENLLGTPPPPPPPDVPELKDEKEQRLTGSLRQRMEQHRNNPPLCASCHQRMDPIGFGLENFNGIGGWRTRDGQFDIEPAGQLVSGESFLGPAELKKTLATKKRDDFVRCLTEKLLTYALGRGLEYYDKCAVREITGKLARADYRFASLVQAVVESVPFQKRRGEGTNP